MNPSRKKRRAQKSGVEFWRASVDKLMKPTGNLSGSPAGQAPPVCLRNASNFSFESERTVVGALESSGMVRVRDGSVECVTCVLPARRVAILVVGEFDCPSGDLGGQVAAAVGRRRVYATARERLTRAASQFGRVVVLVAGGDMGLSQWLSCDSDCVAQDGPVVTVMACPTLPLAVHAFSKLLIPVVGGDEGAAAPPPSALFMRHIASKVPKLPPCKLTNTDLFDLLSGRASEEVCVEHFGWSREQSQAVLRALSADHKVEN